MIACWIRCSRGKGMQSNQNAGQWPMAKNWNPIVFIIIVIVIVIIISTIILVQSDQIDGWPSLSSSALPSYNPSSELTFQELKLNSWCRIRRAPKKMQNSSILPRFRSYQCTNAFLKLNKIWILNQLHIIWDSIVVRPSISGARAHVKFRLCIICFWFSNDGIWWFGYKITAIWDQTKHKSKWELPRFDVVTKIWGE